MNQPFRSARASEDTILRNEQPSTILDDSKCGQPPTVLLIPISDGSVKAAGYDPFLVRGECNRGHTSAMSSKCIEELLRFPVPYFYPLLCATVTTRYRSLSDARSYHIP